MLLNRIDQIPRFHNFIRQITKSSSLFKQNPVQSKEILSENTNKEHDHKQSNVREDNLAKKTDSKPSFKNPDILKKQNTQDFNINRPKAFKNENIKNISETKSSINKNSESLKSLTNTLRSLKNDQNVNHSIKNLFEDAISTKIEKDPKYNKKMSKNPIVNKALDGTHRFKEDYNIKPNIYYNLDSLKPQDKENYLDILKNMEKSLNSSKDLLPLCQQLEMLIEKDGFIRQNFLVQNIKSSVFKYLLKEIKNMSVNDFFNTIHFLLTVEPKNHQSLEILINSNSKEFNINQILDIILLLRKIIAINKKDRSSPESVALECFTDIAKEKLDSIDNYSTLKKAMKLFTQKASKKTLKSVDVIAQETLIVKKIDEKLLKIQDKLTAVDWVDLMNTKSILRHRNINLIEACAYKLTNFNDSNVMNIDAIQSIFLSCSILSFNNIQFFNFLLNKLLDILKTNDTNSDWIKKNDRTLNAIINSIGILKLKDSKILDTLVVFLDKNLDVISDKLIISLIKSVASLDYKPPDDGFGRLTAKINKGSFNLNETGEKTLFLDYVWSLCVLQVNNQELVAAVLDETFWKSLIKEFEIQNPKHLLRPLLLKLFNINLYSIIFMDDYDGPTLPETFTASQCVDTLKPSESSLKSLLNSTLSSYRTIDKYIKLNLLTPYGILIDALLIIDKNGKPLPLENYFSENQIKETNDGEIKIAIKLASYHDFNIINKNLLGTVSFPMKLLGQLGYDYLVITQEELQSYDLLCRVNSIQKKLKDIANKKNLEKTHQGEVDKASKDNKV